MGYVRGPNPSAEMLQRPVNQAAPQFYSDPDNLGFSLKRFKVNKKSFTRPLATVKKHALVSAGLVASFIPIPGVGMLAPKLFSAAKGLVSKVTGRGAPAAGAVQRVSTATIDAAGPQIDITPSADSGSAPVLQRISTATQVLDVAGRIKDAAGGAAGVVTKAADIAGALAAAAGDVAAGGDQIGSRQLQDAAQKIAELARSGQATAENVAGVIQQGGAAVQGAAVGAMAGAGAEGSSQAVGEFLQTTTGKVAIAAAVVGGGWLLARHDNGRGGRGGGSRHWD